MKFHLAILVLPLICGSCLSRPNGAPSGAFPGDATIPAGHWIVCDEPEAEYAVSIHYTFHGVFENREQIYYLRTVMPDKAFEITKNSFIVDGVAKSGEGIGYNGVVDIDPKENGFRVYVRLYWRTEKDTGDYDHEWFLPRLGKTNLQDGRFRASIHVKRKSDKALVQTSLR